MVGISSGHRRGRFNSHLQGRPTKRNASAERRHRLAGVCVAAAVMPLTGMLYSSAFGGTLDTFSIGTDLTVGTNYSAGLPTKASDVVLTTPSTALTVSGSTLTMGSLNELVGNTTAYTISNATAGTTNSVLTLGGTGGNTDTATGAAANDLIYLGDANTLSIVGSTGTGTLAVALGIGTGNFDVANASGVLNISAVVTGASMGLTKSGAGELILAGVNTYSGPTVINGGILSTGATGTIGLSGSIGTSTAAASNLVLAGGTLQDINTAAGAVIDTTSRLFTLGAGGGTIDASGTGSLVFSATGATAFSSGLTSGVTLTLTGSTLGQTISSPW